MDMRRVLVFIHVMDSICKVMHVRVCLFKGILLTIMWVFKIIMLRIFISLDFHQYHIPCLIIIIFVYYVMIEY